MRLDKYLADAGIGTRTEVKKIIAKGRVTVDGEPAKDGSCKLADGALVLVDGKEVCISEFEYYMLNKPAGIVSEARVNSLKRGEKIAEGEEKFCVDLIRESGRTDLFPAGRLDRDTEGLLLITNDGALAHRLLSPKYHVGKTYYVHLDGTVTDEQLKELEAGVDIGDDKPTKSCRTERISEDTVRITITEGRYHQIKRMFAVYGRTVEYLKRQTFGPLRLDETLSPGQYRKLSKEELEELQWTE